MIEAFVILVLLAFLWPLFIIPITGVCILWAFVTDVYNRAHGRRYDPQLREYK